MSAQERIAENIRTKNPVLDLGNCRLTKLPKKLFECFWLENLNLGTSYFDETKQEWNFLLPNNSANRLKNLYGIEKLHNLRVLSFSNNQVSDISPLQSLTNLESLYFWNNRAIDISPLQSLHNLTNLDFSGNQVSDISTLQNLTNLTNLSFWNNQVSDISPLQSLHNLTNLDFSNNQIQVFPYFLKNFLHLTELSFSNNPYKIAGFESLSFLLSEMKDFEDFKTVANFVEKQQQEKEGWVSFKVKKEFARAIKQYLVLFKDFVNTVKGKEIDYYLKEENESFMLITNENTNINTTQIAEYLEEYMALLSKNLQNHALNLENRDIDSEKVRHEIDMFILRYENIVSGLRSEMRILEMDNRELRQEIEKLEITSQNQDKRIAFLQRTIQLSQNTVKTTIYCENQNAKDLLESGFPKLHFLGAFDKTNVFLEIKNMPEVYGIIDRDYLTDAEIDILEKKYPNLIVLRYYCFENYLYHPDNLKEFEPFFDKEAYILRIKAQKESEKSKILFNLKNNRSSYIFFKRNDLKNKDQDFDTFSQLLDGDFEDFYKVLSMKNNKDLCQIKDIGKKTADLVKTQWFKEKFGALLARIKAKK